MENKISKKAAATAQIMDELLNTKNLGRFLVRHEKEFIQETFSQYIQRLSIEKNMVHEHIISRSGIERTYGHRLFSGSRKPSRDTALQLVFGFELNVEEAQTLLRKANVNPLYSRQKRDAVILYGIHKKRPLQDVLDTLYELGLPLLGTKGTEI